MNLTKDQWAEIYYALQDKKRSPTVEGDGTWIAHLDEIIDEIGPDGETASKALSA